MCITIAVKNAIKCTILHMEKINYTIHFIIKFTINNQKESNFVDFVSLELKDKTKINFDVFFP